MQLWSAFLASQAHHLSEENMTRLKSFKLETFHARAIRLKVPSPFALAWFDEHIRMRFDLFAKEKGHYNIKLEVSLTKEALPQEKKSPKNTLFEVPTFSEYFTLDTFVFPQACSESKLFSAHEVWLSGTYNPICFIGPKGSGKSHLIYALADQLKNQGKKVLALHALEFVSRYTKSVRFQEIRAFRTWLRSFDALLIDSIDELAGKKASQEEFFHTFNALSASGATLIFTLSSFDGLEARIETRLQWGLLLPLTPLKEAKEIELALKKKAQFFGESEPEPIVSFLREVFPNFTKACSAIEALFLRLPHQKQISVSQAKVALKDLIEEKSQEVTPHMIVERVAKLFDCTPEELYGRGKARRLSWPRKVAICLIRRELRLSYPAIGRIFNRDHTSILFAVRSADRRKLALDLARL